MGRSVEAVLAAVDRWFPQLSTVNAETALTRIAKLAVETRSTLGGNLNFKSSSTSPCRELARVRFKPTRDCLLTKPDLLLQCDIFVFVSCPAGPIQ